MNNQFIQGVTFDWDRIDNNSYLKRIEAFLGVEKLDFNKLVTFFVGENGSGKSTLLEAIAVAHGFNPEGGTKNYVFSTHDTHSELCDAIRISKGYRKEKWGYFLRAESFYNVATQEEEYADFKHPSAKYHEKSQWIKMTVYQQAGQWNNMNINTDRHLQKLQKPQILHGELVNQYRLAHWMALRESRWKVAGSQ
jgi:predicted ATPase